MEPEYVQQQQLNSVVNNINSNIIGTGNNINSNIIRTGNNLQNNQDELQKQISKLNQIVDNLLIVKEPKLYFTAYYDYSQFSDDASIWEKTPYGLKFIETINLYDNIDIKKGKVSITTLFCRLF